MSLGLAAKFPACHLGNSAPVRPQAFSASQERDAVVALHLPNGWRTAMNTHNAQIDVLSDKELDIVSGGKERVQVTKEQYEQILLVKWLFANLAK
jgi:hypothetical protein